MLVHTDYNQFFCSRFNLGKRQVSCWNHLKTFWGWRCVVCHFISWCLRNQRFTRFLKYIYYIYSIYIYIVYIYIVYIYMIIWLYIYVVYVYIYNSIGYRMLCRKYFFCGRPRPDFWENPTVSMGLGPLQSVCQERFLGWLGYQWGTKIDDDHPNMMGFTMVTMVYPLVN